MRLSLLTPYLLLPFLSAPWLTVLDCHAASYFQEKKYKMQNKLDTMVGKGKEFIAKWESRSKEYILHFLEMFHRDGQIVSHGLFLWPDFRRVDALLVFQAVHRLRSILSRSPSPVGRHLEYDDEGEGGSNQGGAEEQDESDFYDDPQGSSSEDCEPEAQEEERSIKPKQPKHAVHKPKPKAHEDDDDEER